MGSQPAQLKRINGKYIIHEIEHVLHFEKGILYTIRELITNPGKNIRSFIHENRTRLVKPILFIIIASLIYSLASNYFHIEDKYINYIDTKKSTTALIFKWVQTHYGYANILMSVFIALWIKLFFKKYDYNFFEILILLCFVVGMGMLIIALFAVIQGLTHIDLMQIASFIVFIYCTWAIGHFFDKKKIVNYVKAFACYVLGMLTFAITLVVIGTSIDLILKK